MLTYSLQNTASVSGVNKNNISSVSGIKWPIVNLGIGIPIASGMEVFSGLSRDGFFANNTSGTGYAGWEIPGGIAQGETVRITMDQTAINPPFEVYFAETFEGAGSTAVWTSGNGTGVTFDFSLLLGDGNYFVWKTTSSRQTTVSNFKIEVL